MEAAPTSHIPAHATTTTVAPFRAWRGLRFCVAGGPVRATIARFINDGFINDMDEIESRQSLSLQDVAERGVLYMRDGPRATPQHMRDGSGTTGTPTFVGHSLLIKTQCLLW